jgi:hypothetical protein
MTFTDKFLHGRNGHRIEASHCDGVMTALNSIHNRPHLYFEARLALNVGGRDQGGNRTEHCSAYSDYIVYSSWLISAIFSCTGLI